VVAPVVPADVDTQQYSTEATASYLNGIGSNPRREMAVNLIQEQTLMGLSRQEVLNLLGQPIDHSPNQQADLNEQEFLYNLGQLYSGETVLLGVTFDNDQVVNTNIHTW
jgi:hypothetical protein